MRWVLLAAFLVGCGDVGTAGPGTGGTSGTGSSAQAGAAGDGSGGTSATMGTGGSAVDAGLSCAIPMGQINGTDTTAVINRANGDVHCANQTITVPIVNGTYYDTSWTLTSFSVSLSSNPGRCMATFSYERMVASSTCGVPQGTEHLTAFIEVPGI